jgi:hypothetical protein
VKNNIGDKKYNLQILEIIRENNKISKYKCICECGNEKTIPTNKFGVTKTCGCRKTTIGSLHRKWKGYKDIQGGIWYQYIRNANKRNILFDLNIKDAWDIFEQQNQKCALSGLDIKFGRRGKLHHRIETTASLDRINNDMGYTKDNVHWVHKKINQIKMDMSMQEFIELCKKVSNENK